MANVVDSVSELAVESGFSGVIRVDRRGRIRGRRHLD
jgi:hypothetical protein